jgi:SNF2 family DNA or RNA helicase
VTRQHLKHLPSLRELTIPEPLFGSFIENSVPELSNFSLIKDKNRLEQFVTLPFVEPLKAICNISYLDGELDAVLFFQYGNVEVPAAKSQLKLDHLKSFITRDGILARNLVEERELLENLFRDFQFDSDMGAFIAKSEKKIIEFMTETIPAFQQCVTFNCPQNLLDQFIYDKTSFTLSLSHTNRMDIYEIDLKVNGDLRGIRMDRLWDCVVSKKAFIEVETTKKKKGEPTRLPKILVLDLAVMTALVQLFDELGLEKLDNCKLERPLWNLANINETNFEGLPVTFTMTQKLREIRSQMIGEKSIDFSPIPSDINASLRPYQIEGVNWLERLRNMYLNGVLADDMGLGKTLQAIAAITQNYAASETSLVVCPTSLLYNWKEEISKFNPKLKTAVVDGVPGQRKKMIDQARNFDVLITSYTLLQKDIDQYGEFEFSYVILDEAQHIKNRGTRNAKSVKKIGAKHRMILSGTPIENSLDELWSLFDFLMPGFLGSYDRFIEKYIRVPKDEQSKNLEYLKKKVSPFILRRMKSDVLNDLPPLQELTYHCQLTSAQQELYSSYAASARDELVKLVERNGFDKVQIHVLATLTRLKQICCHPAIFAKEKSEEGDSAKYEMLLELLQTLIEGNHKVVIFSQYTKMLHIMREDFEKRKIRFVYLDGSSKNRLDIVNQFNDDLSISVFLVSLKAGGTGLNLVGADTVIHYDMWWNPAVENQATDRVYRLGQDKSVSVYKLVTKNTIEEKIVEMQNRKRGIVKKIVSSDEEALTKLTWEDVLELLQG